MEVAVLALVPVLAVAAAVTWIGWKVLKGLGWLLVRVFRGVGFVLFRVLRFVRTEIVEIIQLVGALVTAAVLVPLTLVNFLIGRWSTGRHYGRAVEDELVSALLGVYRIYLGHPLRLVGLGGVLAGIERRVPDVIDRAPRRPGKSLSPTDFPGYDVVGTLPAGGSGALLYLARPRPDTFERFRRQGRELPAEVVIKSFALEQGSTLPMIVRESRALEAAGRLGLVYEHHLGDDRFFYVMRYVSGEELDPVIARLHARSDPAGLGDRELAYVLGYGQDVVRSLDRFHTGGLWHKDVKPANVIVSDERAHLVDFGLVTPLASAMTLTTHGTEYYRDPEMVRLAMQGVKVHEVDGAKFDLYSAGAVLYSMLENSFPAHGSLSRISKRCPEALEWIVRRSMADIGTRYGSASEMLGDLTVVAAARDPFALRPADLPSMGGAPAPAEPVAAVFGAEPEPVSVGCCEPAASRSKFCLLADQGPPVPRVVRRRRRRRTLVAMVVVTIFFGALASAVLEEHGHGSRTVRVVSASDGFETLHAPERAAVREARAILDGVTIDDEVKRLARRWRRELEPLLPVTPDAPALPTGSLSPPRAGAVGECGEAEEQSSAGRVLVLEDATSSFEPSTFAAVEQALGHRGYEVVGLEDRTIEGDIGWIAGARHAVGLGHPTDGDAVLRLQGFLDESEELDAILWLAQGEDDAGPLYRVLVRSDLTVEPPRRFR